MKLKTLLLLTFVVYIIGCERYTGSGNSYIVISVPFNNQMTTLAVDPRTRCVSLKLVSADKSITRELALSPSSPKGVISGLKSGSYHLEVLLTNGEKRGNRCTGVPVDYAKVKANITDGQNTLSLVMPRGKWTFNSPVNLNTTLTLSNERVDGFFLVPDPHRSKAEGYDYFQAVFLGNNLPQDVCVKGSFCISRVEMSIFFEGPDKVTTKVGTELTGMNQEFLGWVPLSPGTKGPRYFGIISAPPCGYKKPETLLSCSYNISEPSLKNFMKTTVEKDGSLRGYLWEIHVDSENTIRNVMCYSDPDMTDTVPCPTELISDPQKFEILSVNADVPSVETSQALFRNVTLNVLKKYKFKNAEGTVYWVLDERRLVFDVGIHSFTAYQTPLQSNLVESNLFYSTHTDLFDINGIFPVSYDLSKGANLISRTFDPTGRAFLIPHAVGLNFYMKTYAGLFPKDLIYFDGFNFFSVPADNPSAGVYQLSTYTPTSVFCNLKVIPDPMKGLAHVFIREDSAGNCSANDITSSLFYYIRSDMTPSDQPVDITNIFPALSITEGEIMLHLSGFSVSHFIGYDFSGNVYICPSDFLAPCTVQNYSTIMLLGYLAKAGLSFINIDGSLWYFNGTDLINSYIPVDLCVIGEDYLYCFRSDTNTQKTEVFKFDHETKSKKTVGTLKIYFDPSISPEIHMTKNYVLLFAYDTYNNKLLYEVINKKTASTFELQLPVGKSPYMDISSPYGIYGMDFESGDFCYVTEHTVPNLVCIENSKFAGLLISEHGFLTVPFKAVPYYENIIKIFIQEECSKANFDIPCAGGSLYSYAPDMTGKRLIMDLSEDEYVEEVTGFGDILLVHTNTLTSEGRIYAVNILSSSVNLIDFGGIYSVITVPGIR